jgi:hypothetical protein
MTSPEPVVGWRIWRLTDGLLGSVVVDHLWEPGENLARCLSSGRPPCPEAPGPACQCGFWAVWSPRHSVARACPAIEPPWQVLGLIAGWGTVALHGGEGFRAERAAVRCLFSDRPWPWSPRLLTRVTAMWHRAAGRAAGFEPPPAADLLDAPRQSVLRSVAAHYAVPLLTLRHAVDHGVLGELGVPEHRIAEAARLSGTTWNGDEAGEPR